MHNITVATAGRRSEIEKSRTQRWKWRGKDEKRTKDRQKTSPDF